ncbi:MAG TPA: hypothetical protein VLG67_03470 [Candidatus Saccharimonadales bacterium]|nr:hypothetical protein [Candidatus Saccharimonadales bacterium]
MKIITNKGSALTGTIYIILIFAIIGLLSFQLMGGKLPSAKTDPHAQQVIIDPFTPDTNKNNLQLYTFLGHTPVPTIPTPSPPPPTNCEHSSINLEDTMIIGFDPGYNKSVGAGGDIRAWYTDENPPMISFGEVVDSSTGVVKKRGDTTIIDTCSSGKSLNISFEPSLTIGDKVFYPDKIKGTFYPTKTCSFDYSRKGPDGPPIDDFKPYQEGTPGLKHYGPGGQLKGANGKPSTAEYIWHVNSLGLSKGDYKAKIIGHDGDFEIGILCANITIQ